MMLTQLRPIISFMVRWDWGAVYTAVFHWCCKEGLRAIADLVIRVVTGVK